MIALQLTSETASDWAYESYVRAHIARREALGYKRFHPEVWDVPTWALPVLRAGADLIIADRHIRLGSAIVFGSVMACNKPDWLHVVEHNPDAQFVLGGYTSPIKAPNVQWHTDDSVLHSLWPVADAYPLRGEVHGARIALSHGCLHHCDFCTVEPHGRVQALPWADIVAQARGGTFGIVYVDDKTFGQSPNWERLADLREVAHIEGFIVQTTAVEVLKHNMHRWRELGIVAVEIGVESFNDEVLAQFHKPHTCDMIWQAHEKIAEAGMFNCPNILIGCEGETDATYANTLAFMNAVPNLGWFNVYCLADYNDDEAREDILGPGASECDIYWRTVILGQAAALMNVNKPEPVLAAV